MYFEAHAVLFAASFWLSIKTRKCSATSCINPDTLFQTAAGNVTKCYRAFTNKADWTHARLACQQWGGHLLTIDALDENSWISEVLLPSVNEYDRAWMGLHSFESYFWNGAPQANVSYNNVVSPKSLPDSSYPLHCIYISSGPSDKGSWHSGSCLPNNSFVCEKPFTRVPPSTCLSSGATASCSNKNLDQYGVVAQDRDLCLILSGLISNSSTWLSWTDANKQCQLIPSGNLVDIDDAMRWQAVLDLTNTASVRDKANSVWIGLQSTYRWTDGKRDGEVFHLRSESSKKEGEIFLNIVSFFGHKQANG